MHDRNTCQSIGRRARNQYAVLALIVATCTTYRTTAATTLFVPFEEQTNGLPPHLDGLIHYMPQAAVTQPRQSPPPPAPHSTQNPSARTSTLGSAGGSTVATSMPAVGAATPPTGRGSVGVSPTLPLAISQHQLVSPLRPLQLERELAAHPDKGFVSRLITSIKNGCNIRYQGPQFPCTAHHLPTAHSHAPVIKRFLVKECLAGRMAGPYTLPPLPNLRCSGLGVVPKKDGGWRVICHLSPPEDRSINKFINPMHYSLHYHTIDSAISILITLGCNCLMGKIDLKNAFRQVPIRREDWHLLGIQWQGSWYVDKCLPFGLRSSQHYLTNWRPLLSGSCTTITKSLTLSITWMIFSPLANQTQTNAKAT